MTCGVSGEACTRLCRLTLRRKKGSYKKYNLRWSLAYSQDVHSGATGKEKAETEDDI